MENTEDTFSDKSDQTDSASDDKAILLAFIEANKDIVEEVESEQDNTTTPEIVEEDTPQPDAVPNPRASESVDPEQDNRPSLRAFVDVLPEVRPAPKRSLADDKQLQLDTYTAPGALAKTTHDTRSADRQKDTPTQHQRTESAGMGSRPTKVVDFGPAADPFDGLEIVDDSIELPETEAELPEPTREEPEFNGETLEDLLAVNDDDVESGPSEPAIEDPDFNGEILEDLLATNDDDVESGPSEPAREEPEFNSKGFENLLAIHDSDVESLQPSARSPQADSQLLRDLLVASDDHAEISNQHSFAQMSSEGSVREEVQRSKIRQLIANKLILAFLIFTILIAIEGIFEATRPAAIFSLVAIIIIASGYALVHGLSKLVGKLKAAFKIMSARDVKPPAESSVPSVKPKLMTPALDTQTNVVETDYDHQQKDAAFLGAIFMQMSHELYTPLTAIKSYADQARAVLADDDSEVKKFLDMSTRNAEILNNMIGQMLDVAQITQGGLKINRSPIGVNQILEAVLMEYQETIEEKDLTVDFQVGELKPYNGDESRLEWAFDHLINNACTYTPPGGTITLRSGIQNNTISIRIADTGVGIDSHDLPHVFEQFYRGHPVAHDGRTIDVRGAGLGLFIVEKVIEAHGGQVAIDSGRGWGTEVTVRLPLSIA